MKTKLYVLAALLIASMIGSITSQMNIQCDKNGGSAFNFTDVVLMPKSPEGCDNCFYVY